MLEPEYLRIPPSCSLSVTRDILWMNESKWQSRSGMISACSLRANAYNLDDDWQINWSSAPELRLVWLSRFPCPNLTRLDLDYPKLCEAWLPIAINSNMASLQHLKISIVNVHLCISADIICCCRYDPHSRNFGHSRFSNKLDHCPIELGFLLSNNTEVSSSFQGARDVF